MLRPAAFLSRMRRGSPALWWFGWSMLALLVLTLAGLVLDDRVVTGQPVWFKPSKFAISAVIYAWTMSWILSYLVQEVPRLVKMAGAVLTGTLALEMIVIVGQALRGIESHFNATSSANAALFTAMAAAIFTLAVTHAVVTAVTWRHRFADPVLGDLIRGALLVTLIGMSASGAMMSQPRAHQLAALERHGEVARLGGHAVGAPEEDPGLPLIGWNSRGGDLRVGHFLGLHGMQVIPLLGLVAIRRRRPVDRAAAWAISAGWLGLIVAATLQAMQGQTLLAPGSAIVALALAAMMLPALVLVVVHHRSGEARTTGARHGWEQG